MVTDDPVRAPGHTVIMSGTSVAAAVVSGVAAAAWDAAPWLDGHSIMDLVYRSAVTLPDDNGNPARPDFCLGGSCGAFEIRRVSACAVVQLLQPGIVCQTVPAQGGTTPTLPENLYAVPTNPMEGELITMAQSEGDPPLPPGSDPPPAPELGDPLPGDWVQPQPNWPRCAPCQIGNSGLLLGAFDPVSVAASGSVVTDVYVWAGAGYWQSVNPAAIYGYEGGFARLVGGGSYTAGYIVFNVTYVEFGAYVRTYQTPMQSLDWAPF